MKKSVYEYPVIYIICSTCDGFDFMGVDMPGNRRMIKDALYSATCTGSMVIRHDNGWGPPPMKACRCRE